MAFSCCEYLLGGRQTSPNWWGLYFRSFVFCNFCSIRSQQDAYWRANQYTGAPTWSLLLQLTAPGFFFFLRGLGDVSEGECPLEEWVGLDTFLFCGAAGRSADPDGSVTGSRQTNGSLSSSVVPHPRHYTRKKDFKLVLRLQSSYSED